MLNLFQLLFQRVKFRRREEFTKGDAEAVAQFLDRDHAGILAFVIKDAFYGGLRHARNVTQSIRRDVTFFAQFTYLLAVLSKLQIDFILKGARVWRSLSGFMEKGKDSSGCALRMTKNMASPF